MKKIALILSLVMLLGCMTACGSKPAETTVPPTTTAPAAAAPEGTCAELVEKLYENVTVELSLVTETTETSLSDAEMFAYVTGLQSNEGVADVAVSMPMMGSQAYHVVLVRAESGEKAAELAQYLFDNSDMARWVCVQATEKQAVVCGDLAFFVMLDPQYGVTCDQLVEGFTTVCGGSVDSVIK
jgi:hypothetical protein